MKLLMISGDRSILEGRHGAFFATLQELRKHWDRIDVITPRPSGIAVEMDGVCHRHCTQDSEGGEVFFHPCPQGLWYQSLWIEKRGLHLLESHGHDRMTVHEYPPFYNGRGALRIVRKHPIPFALEVHHIVGWPQAATLSERIGRSLSRFVLPHEAKRASAVRVVNKAVRGKLSSWGIPDQKLNIVPSFYLDRALFNQNLRPPIAYDVSFCGRLVPSKGLSSLIEAIAKAPNARLLVIGDGPERERCELLVRERNLGNRVTFLGWLPTPEGVIGALQTARIFVMNSTSEGGPRSALEAMAAGMPVITTKVGVMPEVIRDGVNGIFTTGESSDLAQKISMLLKNEPQRNALGEEARKILDLFERATLVKAYADFLKNL